MADLGRAAFADTFTFTRPVAAPVRNADGAQIEAAIDAPRFDHADDGARLGLLVEAGAELGQGDRVRFDGDQLDELAGERATVLHARRLADGSIERRAWFTRDAVATLDAVLSQEAHHISVAALPGYLPAKISAGVAIARYRRLDWQLVGGIAVAPGIALGDADGRALIGS